MLLCLNTSYFTGRIFSIASNLVSDCWRQLTMWTDECWSAYRQSFTWMSNLMMSLFSNSSQADQFPQMWCLFINAFYSLINITFGETVICFEKSLKTRQENEESPECNFCFVACPALNQLLLQLFSFRNPFRVSHKVVGRNLCYKSFILCLSLLIN